MSVIKVYDMHVEETNKCYYLLYHVHTQEGPIVITGCVTHPCTDTARRESHLEWDQGIHTTSAVKLNVHISVNCRQFTFS